LKKALSSNQVNGVSMMTYGSAFEANNAGASDSMMDQQQSYQEFASLQPHQQHQGGYANNSYNQLEVYNNTSGIQMQSQQSIVHQTNGMLHSVGMMMDATGSQLNPIDRLYSMQNMYFCSS
jgi:hypothetical protein